MEQRKYILWGFFAVVLCCLLTACSPKQPSLSRYFERNDLLLKGLEIDVIKVDYKSNWMDSWCVWIVTVSGEIEGSLLDPSLMKEGITRMAQSHYGLMCSDRKTDGKEPVFELRKDGNYLSRNMKGYGTGYGAEFAVIYDVEQNIYYITYMG